MRMSFKPINRCSFFRKYVAGVSITHLSWLRILARNRSTTAETYDLFNYTSGRWLFNESQRLQERKLEFDIQQLKLIASQSIGQPKSDKASIRKLAEGGFNRVFEITLDDGAQVIARLPYPLTEPKHYAIASEVATIDFLRLHGIPVPRILDYSPSNNNPIGTEYIIMEKSPGYNLGDRWYSMTEQERLKMVVQLVNIEKSLFSISLPASGSIYYERDLPSDVPRIQLEKTGDAGTFCLGPDAHYKWWHGGRSSLNIQRGPFSEPKDLLESVAKREAGPPKHFQNYGDTTSEELVKPSLPSNFDELEKDEQEQARIIFHKRQLHYYYFTITAKLNNENFTACLDDGNILKQKLFCHAGDPWEGDSVTLKADLIRACSHWDSLVAADEGVPCPLEFSPQDVQECQRLEAEQRLADEDMEISQNTLGILVDGWLPTEDYERAKALSENLKSEAISLADSPEDAEQLLRHWPFDDFNEDE